MGTLNIKEKLRKINFRNYLIYQVEPKFKELDYGFSVIRDGYVEFIDTTEEECPTILKLNYSDISRIYIEDILMDIYMGNGIVYHLKQLRLDLLKILNDFKGNELTICNNKEINTLKNYEIALKNNVLSIIGNKIDTDDKIKFRFDIDYNNLTGINEEYLYNGCKRVDIRVKNNNDILIYCE